MSRWITIIVDKDIFKNKINEYIKIKKEKLWKYNLTQFYKENFITKQNYHIIKKSGKIGWTTLMKINDTLNTENLTIPYKYILK